MPVEEMTLQVDITMTALVCAALDGNAAGALVVAQVIGLTDLGHELNIELAAAWLAHGKRRSAEPDKFSDAEVILMAAFRRAPEQRRRRMSKPPKSIKTEQRRAVLEDEPDVTTSVVDPVDDVFDLPAVDEDVIVTGAAADATDLEERLKDLPRILRVALLIDQGSRDITIDWSPTSRRSPGLRWTRGFRDRRRPRHRRWRSPRARSVRRRRRRARVPNSPTAFACSSLRMQKDLANSEEYRRVTQTLMNALARSPTEHRFTARRRHRDLLRGLGDDPCAETPAAPLPRPGLVPRHMPAPLAI